MTPRTSTARQYDVATLREALAKAQQQRSTLEAETGGDPSVWIEHERAVMTQVVTRLLKQHRVDIEPTRVEESVRGAEEHAAGYIDYIERWAMGCADLVDREIIAARVSGAADRHG